MASAHVSLMMCVKSMVHGVRDSAKYLAISKKVQNEATKLRPTLVASHLYEGQSARWLLDLGPRLWDGKRMSTYTTSMTGTPPCFFSSSNVFMVSPSLQAKRPIMVMVRASWMIQVGNRTTARHLARSNCACERWFPFNNMFWF